MLSEMKSRTMPCFVSPRRVVLSTVSASITQPMIKMFYRQGISSRPATTKEHVCPMEPCCLYNSRNTRVEIIKASHGIARGTGLAFLLATLAFLNLVITITTR